MLFVMDAGHHFNTPGKQTPDGMKEYEFNRAVANYAKELLEDYENAEVIFTHSDDKDVSLQERTDKANELKADVFVSIHANAHGNGQEWTSASGIETYVYTTKPTEAYTLAQWIQNELIRELNRKNRGVKTANFHVLRETKMTAILIECGFMTNQEEARLLKTDSYRKKCAEAIVKGLVTQYKLKVKPKPQPKQEAPKKGLYKVQVGAFSKKENAERLAADLKKKGFPVYIVHE